MHLAFIAVDPPGDARRRHHAMCAVPRTSDGRAEFTADLEQTKKITLSLAHAVKELHDHKIIHGDIKTNNVVLEYGTNI